MLSVADFAHSSSSNHYSSRVTAVSGENSNSPQSRRGFLPSSGTQVLRGEQETTSVVRHSPPSSASSLSSLAMSIQEETPFVDCSATQVAHSPLPRPPENPASAENSDENHVNTEAQNKKPAWNKPSNGVVEVGPVMGAVASPVLSESAETSPKFQDGSSSREAADGSTSTSQEPANLNHIRSNATPNSTSNHAMPIQQRFNSRGIHRGNGGGPPHGGYIRPSQAPAPSFSMFQVAHNSYGNLVPPVANTSLGEPSYPNNYWNPRPFGGYLPQPHPVNNHHGVSQRGNFNPYIRRNSVHQNNNNRWDHHRRSFVNGRNVHMHQQRPHPRGTWRPSTSPPYTPPTHFFSPQPVRAYGDSMFYHVPFDGFLSEHLRGPRLMTQQPTIQSIFGLSVSTSLVNQINYYFCDANLVNDKFLKSHMDDQGWVSINLVAGFPRVKKLTNDIKLILNSLRASTVVEVQGDKIRRRHEWINWIQKENPTPAHSLSPSESSQDLPTMVQHLKIEEVVNDRTGTNGREDSIFGDDAGKMKGVPNSENTRNANSGK